MSGEQLLKEIGEFCREAGLAESTFGRLAINDGKLVSRLRDGGRITTETLDRLRTFMDRHRETALRASPAAEIHVPGASAASFARLRPPARPNGHDAAEGQTNFRFFDNRQKYLLFVNTCSEKWVVANRVAMEFGNISPRPPALRLFDAGMGDGTVLSRVLRAMHARFPTMPFYVVGKEISLEDVRLTLEKLSDRFFEHPASVITLTNLYYAEAPWLTAKSPVAAQSLLWKEVALTGNSSHDFEEQLTDLQSFLSENWTAKVSARTGNPIYERPLVLSIYREDHRFLLDPILPRPGRTVADFDLIIASQPYRAGASAEFKAKRVISPLSRALGPGGRLIGIHSRGDDPGLEIVQQIWPDENPFQTDRHQILKAVKADLGSAGRYLNFNAYADARSNFRYEMHTLPGEVQGSIGTSTLFAAWNAAIYVAQVEDQRLSEAIKDNRYLRATDSVLKKYGGLWFNDESYVISRKRN
jgi:SAM-dependent methyltransferase